MTKLRYREMPLIFQIQKVLRYVDLYGPSRTISKIFGQLHTAKDMPFEEKVWLNPHVKSKGTRRVGVIGCGSFTYTTICHYLGRHNSVFLKGAMDLDPSKARSLVSKFGGCYATTDASVILGDPDIDLIYIASNHASHAEYAIEAIRRGKNVHIEKPHVVNRAQLSALEVAMIEHPNAMVFLGFNRPHSRHFRRLLVELNREGGPSMINWFVAGHAIDDDHWYFNEAEGGRILGNLCHWSDLTLALLPPDARFPCKIVPASDGRSRSDFVTSIVFPDGSLAAITFSAKGSTFEGVREVLQVHKGDLIAEIRDFKSLFLTRGPSRRAKHSRFREHGHRENILNSYLAVCDGDRTRQPTRQHVLESAELFLAIRDAHSSGKPVVAQGVQTVH